MSLIGAVTATGANVNACSSDFVRLALYGFAGSESVKRLLLAHSGSNPPTATREHCEESNWSDLSAEIMQQIITLLSDQLISSCMVWPQDTRIPSVQLVCRHWHDISSTNLLVLLIILWSSCSAGHKLCFTAGPLIQATQASVVPQGCKALPCKTLKTDTQALCLCKVVKQQSQLKVVALSKGYVLLLMT